MCSLTGSYGCATRALHLSTEGHCSDQGHCLLTLNISKRFFPQRVLATDQAPQPGNGHGSKADTALGAFGQRFQKHGGIIGVSFAGLGAGLHGPCVLGFIVPERFRIQSYPSATSTPEPLWQRAQGSIWDSEQEGTWHCRAGNREHRHPIGSLAQWRCCWQPPSPGQPHHAPVPGPVPRSWRCPGDAAM